MPTTPANVTIEHDEQNGSPEERIDEDGRFVVRRLRVAWDDRYTLFRQLAGGVAVVDGEAGTQIITLPDTFDPDDGFPTPLWARSFGITPFDEKVQDADGDGRVAKYNFALLTVEYRTGRFGDEEGSGGGETEDQPNIVIEERIEPEAENINVQRDNLFWESGNKAGDEFAPLEPLGIPGKIDVSVGWIVTYYNVLDPIPDAFWEQLGTINTAAIVSEKFGRNWEANTLLYSSMNASRTFTTIGANSWTITCRFSYRRHSSGRTSKIIGAGALGILGWNGFWHAEVSDWDSIATGDTSLDTKVPVYEESNFGALLLRLGT